MNVRCSFKACLFSLTGAFSMISLPGSHAAATARILQSPDRIGNAARPFRYIVRPYIVDAKSINIFTGPPLCSGGNAIATGLANRLWYALSGTGCRGGAIISLTTAGDAVAYLLPPSVFAAPETIFESADATRMWFTAARGSEIGSITARGEITHYSAVAGRTMHAPSGTSGVARGEGGTMWFTVPGRSKIGFVPAGGGKPTVISLGINGVPNAIVGGPDGDAYFAEVVPRTREAAVAHVTRSGAVTEYALPRGFIPGGLTIGPDRNVWVVDATADRLAQLVVPAVTHNAWSLLSSKGFTARSGACATAIGTTIYVVGGENASGAVLDLNEAYDTKTNTWSTKASMPTPRTTLACAAVGNTLYAVGGGTTSSWLATVESYDAATNKWTKGLKSLPKARNSLSGLAYDGKVYVVGGYDANGRSKETDVYDPSTQHWTLLATMHVGRSEVGLGLIGSTIVGAGGVGGETDNEAYSIANNSWKTLAASPTARYNGCAGGIGSSLYFAGGSNGSPLASLDIYNDSENKWATPGSGAPMKTAVTLPAGVVFDGKLLCFGGGKSDFVGAVYNLVQSYQP